MPLPEGLYDLLLSEQSKGDLPQAGAAYSPSVIELSSDGSHERIGDGLSRTLTALLDEVEGDESEKVLGQIAIVNALLADLRTRFSRSALDLSPLLTPPQVLTGIFRGGSAPVAPDTGLMAPWLFTASKGSPSLLTELRK